MKRERDRDRDRDRERRGIKSCVTVRETKRQTARVWGF
jgi:hypothetical protein